MADEDEDEVAQVMLCGWWAAVRSEEAAPKASISIFLSGFSECWCGACDILLCFYSGKCIYATLPVNLTTRLAL